MTAAASPVLTSRDAELHASIGYATMLLARTDRRQFSIGAVELWVAPAAVLKQIAFHFDGQGVPDAFVTWAFLSDRESQRMERDAVNVLPLCAWNEGLNPWVIDVVAPFGIRRPVVRELLRAVSVNCERDIRWLRRSAHGAIPRARRLPLSHSLLRPNQGTT